MIMVILNHRTGIFSKLSHSVTQSFPLNQPQPNLGKLSKGSSFLNRGIQRPEQATPSFFLLFFMFWRAFAFASFSAVG